MNWPTKWLWRSDFLEEKKSWKKKDKIDERGHLSPLQREKTGEQKGEKTNATSSNQIPIKVQVGTQDKSSYFRKDHVQSLTITCKQNKWWKNW